MGTLRPLMLVLDADLPMVEKQQFALRGAKFDTADSFLLSGVVPSTVSRLWISRSLPELTQRKIIEIAKSKKVSVSCSNSLESLRDLLQTLPDNGSGNWTNRKQQKNNNGNGKSFAERHTTPPSETLEPITFKDVELGRLKSDLATAIEENKQLERRVDGLVQSGSKVAKENAHLKYLLSERSEQLKRILGIASTALKPGN